MASGLQFNDDQMRFALAEFDARVQAGISATVDFTAARSEGQMKSEAPWTDRTGAARTGLHAETDHQIRAWTLVLAHAVSYGIWLETAHDKQYAIILKVLVDAGNQLMATLEGLFRRI